MKINKKKCFFIISGCICVTVGVVIAILDLVWPHRFSTVLEVDYDTPYDRHVLIVDSRQRARPQTQASLPTRILRSISPSLYKYFLTTYWKCLNQQMYNHSMYLSISGNIILDNIARILSLLSSQLVGYQVIRFYQNDIFSTERLRVN